MAATLDTVAGGTVAGRPAISPIGSSAAFAVVSLSLVAGCLRGDKIPLGDVPGEIDGGVTTDGPDAQESGSACSAGEPVSAERSALLAHAVGFGSSATGGLSGCVHHVTDLGDTGPGTLREALGRPEPLWIVFDRSGEIALDSDIDVQSDKTLDGRGQTITVRNRGLSIAGPASNVIIENVRFVGRDSGSANDAVHIAEGARAVWVDHCSMSQYGDGLVDITQGATDITVSWSRFFEHDLVMLIGASEIDDGDGVIRVTLHHNVWEQTGNYAPRLRFGRVHMFNNLIDRWIEGASAVTMQGEICSESNIFTAGDDNHAIRVSAGSDSVPGRVRSTGDWLQKGATIEQNEADAVFRPSELYDFTLESAGPELASAIADGAGAH